MRASTPVLPGEDPRELEAVRDRVQMEVQPTGVIEEFLAEQIVQGMQRLARAGRVETGVLLHRLLEIERGRALASLEASQKLALGSDLLRMEVIVTDERQYADATARLQQVSAAETEDLPYLGRAFHADAAGPCAIELATRYRAGIERSLLRMLHEVREIQAARQRP